MSSSDVHRIVTVRKRPKVYGQRYVRYDPGDDLEEQIESHRDVHGKRCRFVECEYVTPDFKAFDEEQLAYYLYFRDRFMDGEVLQSDLGYSWLLLVELINDRRDPQSTMAALMRYYQAVLDCAEGFPGTVDVQDALFSYAAANGLDLPRIHPVYAIWQKILVSEALLPFPEPLGEDMFGLIVGSPLEDYDDAGSEDLDVDALFDSALPAVDDRLRETTGRGILETYGDGTVSREVRLFSHPRLDPYYYHDHSTVITYTEPTVSVRFFLGEMYRYCEKSMEVLYGTGKGPSVSAVFGSDLRGVVDSVLDNGDIIEAVYRSKTFRGTVRGIPDNDDSPFVVPVVGRQIFENRGFRKSLGEYEHMEPAGPCGYVSSGGPKPDPRHMGADAVGYYLYWRSLVRKGVYRKTDEGYLWLYECELINSRMPEDRILEQLRGLAAAYDRFFEVSYDGLVGSRTKRPGRTYMDFAFMRLPRIPDTTVFPCRLCGCDMIEAIAEDPEVPVCKDNFLSVLDFDLSRKADRELSASFDDDCVRIAARVLHRINGTGGWESGRIRSYCGIGVAEAELNVFADLAYYDWPDGGPDRQYRPVMDDDNESLQSDLRKLLKAVAASARDRGRKRRKALLFGLDASGVIEEETRRLFSEKAMEKASEESMSMVLDRSEVERAESDLRHVTELVGTDDGDRTAAEEAQAPAPAPASGDPWVDLASRLDKGQREYLRKALEGTLRAAKPTTEGPINDIAMDTVKDAIVEDGKVFDEYASDLERALGRSGL